MYAQNGVVLSNNNKTVCLTAPASGGGYRFNAVASRPVLDDAGVCSFSVRIDTLPSNGIDCFVGFAPRSLAPDHFTAYNTCGWYVNITQTSLSLFSQNGGNHANHSHYYARVGDVISCLHDTKKHTISFKLNDATLVFSFKGVAAIELYPAALFHPHYTDILLTLV